MIEPRSGRKPSAAANTLALLNAQAAAVRLELVQLREELAAANRALQTSRAADLVHANEQLVVAALRAEAIAETAVNNLARFVRLGERDPLTDTPNRAAMFDRMDVALTAAHAHHARAAVMFVDLDDFKQINDTFGHAVGDEVMRVVARRVASVLRASDTVGRHGGDEFLVLLPEIAEVSDAEDIARKILSTLAAPALVGKRNMGLSASVGIAVYPDDGEDAVTLIQRADAAMFRAKRRGPGQFELHHADALGLSGPDDGLSGAGQANGVAAPRDARLRDLREANEQLVLTALNAEEARVRREDVHRRQVRFLALVAHELRDPLAPVRAAAELISRTRTDPSALAALKVIIDRQASHVTRLVDDLIAGSAGSVGQMQLAVGLVDMLAVIGEAIDACAPVIKRKSQALRTALPTGPVDVRGDKAKLTSAVQHLLDNATKFTPEHGSIGVDAATTEDVLTLIVSDSGAGIAADALSGVFDVVVHDSGAPVTAGRRLGVGLATVRDIVEAHAGSVVATSDGPGLGSQFVVKLPLAREPG